MLPPANDPEPSCDDAPWRGVAEMLAEQGFTPVPSAQTTPYELRGRLWELLYALAGKRLFFFHSDHLSDRDFYSWLEANCLPSQAADLTPDSEWNCYVDVSESGTAAVTGERLVLRYYADAATRATWQQEHPGQPLPAHRPLPFHRDPHLPRPHAPIKKAWPLPGFASDLEELDFLVSPADEKFDFSELEAETEDFLDQSDPLGLAAVDREIHRQGFGGNEDDDDDFPSSETFPPDFFASSAPPETPTLLRPIEVLRQRHYTPLPMPELTEETIAPALWELLHELHRMNFYVVHTDHLSDAELYQELTRSVLYREVIIAELMETAACYHDCLHQNETAALELWLKYYATAEQHLDWADQHPSTTLPNQAPLPYHRDWHLPQLPVRP